jgi:hypothetical protein
VEDIPIRFCPTCGRELSHHASSTGTADERCATCAGRKRSKRLPWPARVAYTLAIGVACYFLGKLLVLAIYRPVDVAPPAPRTAVVSATAGRTNKLFGVELTNTVAPNSNFDHRTTGRGISMDVPKHWVSFNESMEATIRSTASAAAESVGDTGEGVTTLYQAHSPDKGTFATARINAKRPPALTPTEAASLTQADLDELSQLFKGQMRTALNCEILDWDFSTETVGGHPAIRFSFRRSSAVGAGPVRMTMHRIFCNSDTFDVLLSHRENEDALWLPIFSRMERSIRVP